MSDTGCESEKRQRFSKNSPVDQALRKHVDSYMRAVPMNLRAPFAKFVATLITERSDAFVSAIDRFNNSYKWNDGVPNLATGQGKIPIHRDPEYSDLFAAPRSFHMPRGRRVGLTRQYVCAVIDHSYENPELWVTLAEVFPEHKDECALMGALVQQEAQRSRSVS